MIFDIPGPRKPGNDGTFAKTTLLFPLKTPVQISAPDPDMRCNDGGWAPSLAKLYD